EQPNKEICTIRIIFPVNSDEQALEAKKKISEVLADVPDAQVHFAIMPQIDQPRR
ncbi:unnamed protein product, partial [marine sediment metagenome]